VCVPTPSTSHVMPVTWFPGTQSSKSESDFIFNRSKSTGMLMVSIGSCFGPFPLESHVRTNDLIIFAALSADCNGVWHRYRWKLLITSTFFMSSPLSRAAPSLSEISLQNSGGEMQPCQSNYITLIARLETTIEALFPGYSTSSFPLSAAHMLMWYWKSLCASNRLSSVVREQKTCIINVHMLVLRAQRSELQSGSSFGFATWTEATRPSLHLLTFLVYTLKCPCCICIIVITNPQANTCSCLKLLTVITL